MSQLRETVAHSRESFRTELRKRPLPVFLVIGIIVTAVDLVKAYQRRDISDAIVVIVLWMVLFPLFGYWMYRKRPGE